jgi:hypothetical protein
VLVGLFVVGAISSVIDLTDWYSRWPVPWWVWVIAVLVILVITLAQKWHQAERELENVRAGRAQASRLDRKLKQEFDERIDEAAKLLELGVVNDDWIRQSDEWVARTVSWIEEHLVTLNACGLRIVSKVSGRMAPTNVASGSTLQIV